MLKLSVLALLVASAAAFSPAAMNPSLRLRSATRLSMVEKSEASPLSKVALTALVAGSFFVGGMPPAEASINSQMSMNTESFSVLSDNQKVYAQKARTVNPYATEEEQMQQLEKIARLEECQKKSTSSQCEKEETIRAAQVARESAEQRRSPLTFAVPVVITTALSGVLIKILNR